MPFDVQAARKAGYNDDEILKHLTSSRQFDVDGALKSGYSKTEIIDHLAGAAAPAAAASARSWMDEAGDVLKGAWSKLNPVEAAKRVATAVSQPVDALKGVGAAQDELRIKAETAFKAGDYLEGLRHTINWAIPMLGPEMDGAGDKAQQGKVAEALGESVGIGVANVGPGALKNLPGAVKVTPTIKGALNAAGRQAVAFAESKGIPLSLADRTGSKLIRNVEGLAQNQLGGSGYAQRARGAQAERIDQVGRDLAGQVSPTATTKELAGSGVVKTLEDDIRNLHTQANQSYSKLHKIEKHPANVQDVPVGVDNKGKPITAKMALPVDMRPIKDALKDLAAQYDYTTPQARQRASVGYKALDNIINGPDFKPASAAEIDLGMLKEAARSEMPELRDISQGLAANGVKELQTAIDAAVSQAHMPGGVAPGSVNPALQALQDGRKFTAQKWQTDDLLKTFGSDVSKLEPVQVYQRLTWERDAGIESLRKIAAKAPGDMAKVGRAYIEGLLETIRDGDIGKARGVLNRWEALGPETKKVLFKNPVLIKDLDNFFALAKKVADNPNPSGSAYVASIIPTVGLIVTRPDLGVPLVIGNAALSRMLFSPKASRALANGLKVPLGNKPAAAAAATQILSLAGKDAQPLEQQ